jgi:hypothetical protein
MHRLFETASFRNRDRAMANLDTLSADLPENLQSRIYFLLSAAADPDMALHCLSRFHTEKREEFRRLSANPSLLLPLITIFCNSRRGSSRQCREAISTVC